jgi:ACGX-repeat protein
MTKIDMLAGWSGNNDFFGKRSAQSYFKAPNLTNVVSGGCGSACGTGDGDRKKEEPKPSACGSACGAGDADSQPAEEQKPSACGSACGAGDN